MSAADSPREGNASGQSGLTKRIVATPLFRDRPRNLQIVLGGVVPVLVGAVAGVLIGAAAPAYWVWAILAGIGAFLSGFEHRDGWGGADRGFFGGLFYGTGLLVMHAILGTQAKVSLGSFPPLLAVVSAIFGMFLAAGGGRIARGTRAKAGIVYPDSHDSAS